MRPIRLPPVEANDAEPIRRVNIFPHRHLGEVEFDIRDRYLTKRLDALAAGSPEGAVAGLDLAPPAFDATAGGAAPDRIMLQPGLAVAGGRHVLRLSAPISLSLAEIGMLAKQGDGFYLLALRLVEDDTVWGPAERPDAREETDPLRDARRDSFVEAVLSTRLGPLPATLDGAAADRFANLHAAGLFGGSPMGTTGGAVPIALLALRGGRVVWLNQAAGRWEAAPDAGSRLLLAQVRDAMGRAMPTLQTADRAAQSRLAARCPRLPAAAMLPAILLRDPAGPAPECPFLPPRLVVLMTPLPASAVPAVMRRELRRAPLDLEAPAGEAAMLLLVVADRDWRPNLADMPRPDLTLLEQLFAAFHQARLDWRSLRQAHDALFAGLDAMPEAVRRRLAAALALAADQRPTGPRAALGLAAPATGDQDFDAAITALAGGDTFAAWAAAAGRPAALDALGNADALRKRLIARGEALDAPPEPPADPAPLAAAVWGGKPPAAEATYARWLGGRATVDYAAPASGALGLVAELVLAQCRLVLVEARVAHYASLLAEHDDLLVTQRGQMQFMTSALARLTAPGSPASSVALAAAPQPGGEEATGDTAAGRPVATGGLSEGLRFSLFDPAPQTMMMAFKSDIGSKAGAIGGLFAEQQVSAAASPAFLAGLSPQGAETGFARQLVQLRIAEPVAKGGYARDTATSGITLARQRMQELGFASGDLPDLAKIAPRITDATVDDETKAISTIPAQIEVLFGALGRIERRRRDLQARQLDFAQTAALLRQRIATLTAEIAASRAARLAAARTAQASEGDYLSAQRLVAEDTQRVARLTRERERILGNPLALLCVRRRQTQIALPLPDPLPLRDAAPGDIVPGCRDTHDAPLPEGVDQFLDFVLDLPVAAFARLAGLETQLPAPAGLAALLEARTIRLQARGTMAQAAVATLGVSATPAAPRLLPILQRAREALVPLAARRLPVLASLAATQREAARVLSVADVLAGRRGRLREAASALRDTLETAGHCMLASLAKLPPSVRFAWSEAAEENALDLRRPERWPFFGVGAEQEEVFNALRSVTELVLFLQRQLADEADGTAQATMGAYIRALLIEAAHGEPEELLRGRVLAVPRLVQPGAILRLELTRPAAPGTRLQLLDDTRRLVAELRVDDRDGEGTVASLVRIADPAAELRAGLAVVAAKG
jgi:hypothetical protein